MRIRHAVMLALAGSMAVACGTRDDADTEPGLLPEDVTPTTEPTETDMIVARSDFQPTSQAEGLNVSGWAEFRQRGSNWRDDGLELRVHLMGLSEGDHAWHIHEGTCESPGRVVLPISDFGEQSGIGGDLNAGADGMAEETVTIDRDRLTTLDTNQQLVINVHLRGGDEPGPGIACAPVQLQGAGMTTQPGTTQPGTTQPPQPQSPTGGR
jgi:Cu/Zn superoxide dismutase